MKLTSITTDKKFEKLYKAVGLEILDSYSENEEGFLLELMKLMSPHKVVMI